MKLKRKYSFICAILILLVWSVILWATTFKYLYTAEVVLAETNGYGGAVADLAADSAYDYTADIDLETNGYYGVWITLEHNSSGTTDDIVISYFSSYDGTNFDDVALWSVTCDASSGADLQQTFSFFPAPPHGRIGVKTTGTTDTFDYQITYHPVRGDGT
jgi:hypothetical protein